MFNQLRLLGRPFQPTEILQAIPIPGGDLLWQEDFLGEKLGPDVFSQLHSQIAWRQEFITLYGKRRAQPRLTAWYGDPGTTYRYSGLTLEPRPWLPLLRDIKAVIEPAVGARFNSALVNLYRTGQDSMGWHSDDEPELGRNPIIASVSLGASRRFLMRHRSRPQEPKIDLTLTHGSLLVMKGATQHHWQHQVPKTIKSVGSRINLTFRQIR